jgi:hypothetical protein
MLDATIAIRMDRGLFAITHSQHKAANVKERPFAKNAGWPHRRKSSQTLPLARQSVPIWRSALPGRDRRSSKVLPRLSAILRTQRVHGRSLTFAALCSWRRSWRRISGLQEI